MKRLAALLFALCALHSGSRGVCLGRIREFYAAYLTDFLQDGSRREALCREFLTPELVAKLERVGNATGADPVIRAQDTTPDALRTLTVSELPDDWYMVSYRTREGGTPIEIPLKAQLVDGSCKITYITPVWHGTRSGDELLACSVTATPIDTGSALSFLGSFYDAYLTAYCAMPRDLDERLAALREEWLTPRARELFRGAEAENRLDGTPGYDALVAGFDFDCLWLPELRITPLPDNRYRVTYPVGETIHRIGIMVTRENGKYLIDDILP